MKVDNYLKKMRIIGEKYDIVLIHIDSFYNLEYAHYNMGLLYMATVLKEKGFKVKCLGVHELFRSDPGRIRRLFSVTKPACVGFYTVSDNIYQVRNFADNVKKWSPLTKVIVGGPLATSLGRKMLEHPSFDLCVAGEGESPILQIMDLIINGKGKLHDIEGLIFREGNEIVANPPSEPAKDLDRLPFPDNRMVPGQKNFHIVSGRGCPYNCIFCFQGVHGLKYRYRSAESVVGEIVRNLEELDSSGFDIIDDTFISNPSRVREIAEKLEDYRKKSRRDFIFFCQGRVDIMDKHPDMLGQLKRAGLVRVQIGLESGSQRVLDIYRKKISPDQIRRVVKHTADTGGMTIVGNFILGGPFENEETFNDTLCLAKDLISEAPGVFELGAAFMGPYPGTPIAEAPEKYGLKIIDNYFNKGLTLSDVHMTSQAFDVNGMRELDRRFTTEIMKHMESMLPRIPRELIGLHFEWEARYGLVTFWNSFFFSARPALKQYFMYLSSPRFLSLFEIPLDEIMDWYPLRVVEKREYSVDGRSIILPETMGRFTLDNPDEILIYELSAGKLTIGGITDEIIKTGNLDASRFSVLRQKILPFYAKLEDSCHMVYYK